MGIEDLVVLVIEDNRPLRRIIQHFLSNMKFRSIVEAETGDLALGILKTHHVDLIIADINIPAPNGIQLLRWVRENEATRDVPFLIISGESQEHIIRRVMELGATAYLMKPLSFQTVKSKLERILLRMADHPSPGDLAGAGDEFQKMHP